MRYLIILVLFSLFPLSCVTTPAESDCANLDVILLTIQEKYYPDSIEVRHKILKEEIYFPKVNVLSITLINPSFEFLDFQEFTLGHRFENYEQLDSLIGDEFLPEVNLLIQNCEMRNTEEIMLTIGSLNNSGNLITRFTINYPVETFLD